MPSQSRSYYLPQRAYVPPAKPSDSRDRVKSAPPGLRKDGNRPTTSEQRITMRKEAAEGLKGKLRSAVTGRSGHQGDRHVTFQEDLPKPEIHPAFRKRPVSGRAGDVTLIDHQIARYGGSTSTLECLPHRLRISKAQPNPSPKERIEELQRENGHLRRELTYYKDNREVLMKLFDSIQTCHRSLQEALAEASRGVAISEQRFVDYWAPHRDEGNVEESVF